MDGATTVESESELRRLLERNLASVWQHIRNACARSGRSQEEIKLVAITKTVPPSGVRALAELGQRDFGENRVQEALAKVPQCPTGLRWHLVGHLQRNKAGKAAQCFDCIHSVDGLAVAEALERGAGKAGKPLPCFLEVNMSGEAAKHGVPPDEALSLAQNLTGTRRVHLVGLMTMAPFDPEPEHARPHFRALRELRERINSTLPVERRLAHLSMGMSQDFVVAVEEGATHVRVGTALFQDLDARAYSGHDPKEDDR
jgi:pyridoxal phosphate enzyme (YggS family)